MIHRLEVKGTSCRLKRGEHWLLYIYIIFDHADPQLIGTGLFQTVYNERSQLQIIYNYDNIIPATMMTSEDPDRRATR
jgi:hypothetical protein